MTHPVRVLAQSVAVGLLCAIGPASRAADERELPAAFSPEQKTNVLKFLKDHEKPERYVPKGARFADSPPPDADLEITATKDKPVRQYTVQITPHRPVPDQEKIGKADVYFYRPNPEKGKPGITIKHTIDLATGKQIGETEVLTKAHTPVSHEELTEAVAAARSKVAAVKDLYETYPAGSVRWEYLQMKIQRKTEQFEPGDRVVRFVFTATPAEGQKAPEPVGVLVNLTKDTVARDSR
ncbi:hypothetical protein [Frigoriglobus tundricola]|uniref:Uncharacterized protein n=1 Tax=Frigoriglobus tundricola TaxID=2774151 RepID=A0A6M5YZ30_9BACT|nr:hypothetical protein [Frigoriglobus tundricola]QJW99108.1 hypothetical protein FTUN_6706 [Frigoriglobus tundricola]